MMRIIRKQESVSTNLDARAAKPFDVIVAETQTGGRGRLDHVWHSAPGENLTFSAVLPAPEDPARAATLPLVAGLAVCNALGDGFMVKWPNDVYHGGRKAGGILCERVGDSIIVGIGLNVNETCFPSEIAARATSLKLIFGRTQNRDEILERVLSDLERAHAIWYVDGFAPFLEQFAARDFLAGREVKVLQTDGEANPLAGPYGGIRADGSILVGSAPVYAGELQIVQNR